MDPNNVEMGATANGSLGCPADTKPVGKIFTKVDLGGMCAMKRPYYQENSPDDGRSRSPSLEKPRKVKNRRPVFKFEPGFAFVQNGTCTEVAPELPKCRECLSGRPQDGSSIFCRFYGFRRLGYDATGTLVMAGFLDTRSEISSEDLKLWQPIRDDVAPGLDPETSRFLITEIGDHFCQILLHEREANEIDISEDKMIAWKRVVQGVREMCDVCDTTLFNFHWTCGRCGFAVCIDCYKSRRNGALACERAHGRDKFFWLSCYNRDNEKQHHYPEKMTLTQIVPGDILEEMGARLHALKESMGLSCSCIKVNIKEERDAKKNDIVPTPSVSNEFQGESSTSIRPYNKHSIRDNLTHPWPQNDSNGSDSLNASPPNHWDAMVQAAIEAALVKTEPNPSVDEKEIEFQNLKRRVLMRRERGEPSNLLKVMLLSNTVAIYPKLPHSWLCEGKMLRLKDPMSPWNFKAFQDQWKKGLPVLVSGLYDLLDRKLWTPQSFHKDFGTSKHDLVNCVNGNLVPKRPMKKFWAGFRLMKRRLKDKSGQPMILKLKDWPPRQDFAEMLPTRFADLMRVLPMGEYTHRTGRLNLASRLPECFVPPDLGPKMYTAYGSSSHPTAGTTNLHLDISDAINVMVHVGTPSDIDREQYYRDVNKAVNDAGCDQASRNRLAEEAHVPGAVWHIYLARDTNKIRDLLNKISVERGTPLRPNNDPIHDQCWYLDANMRHRLYTEYGVRGFSIIQCLGDAVFIPAGAPHQVRNLNDCIKVAEDFVSPENVARCLHLTQEFRKLSKTHTNHEDKLQIKNIIYHSVKDAMTMLGRRSGSLGPF